MDKHDRPYRCPHESCAKLQGFTYSGGLLRHEREVHGKHGGPKSQMMCPYPECKRHLGKGFTRKENLNEHLRRVHPKDGQVQMAAHHHDPNEAGLGAHDAEMIDSGASAPPEHDPALVGTPGDRLKRKRSMPATNENGDLETIEDLQQEIKRLRAELQHKDAIIASMATGQAEQNDSEQQLKSSLHMIQQPMQPEAPMQIHQAQQEAVE